MEPAAALENSTRSELNASADSMVRTSSDSKLNRPSSSAGVKLKHELPASVR